MTPDKLACLVAVVLASLTLISMMRRRQAKLMNLIHEYISGQTEWARKRAKAVRMAKMAARNKEKQESTLKALLARNPGVPDEDENNLTAADIAELKAFSSGLNIKR
ncbi:MAG: hypothetical protein KDB03_24380 [Planctomycetales bacterium]|nr:hypothetical protein [Planctomycetales bacterium]